MANPPLPTFMLHHAASLPGHHSAFVNYNPVVTFGVRSEYRVTADRPVPITSEALQTYQAILNKHFQAGLLKLRTPDGRPVDPATLEALTPVRAPATPIVRPLDIIQNDANAGKGHMFAEHVVGHVPGTPVTETAAASDIAAFGAAAEGAEEEVVEIPRAQPINQGYGNKNAKGRR